jgi:hypothetical protein
MRRRILESGVLSQQCRKVWGLRLRQIATVRCHPLVIKRLGSKHALATESQQLAIPEVRVITPRSNDLLPLQTGHQRCSHEQVSEYASNPFQC